MHWYVKVENQAYGPYSDTQMCGFVAEGRVTPYSLISNASDNGFFGASEFDAFNLWCSTGLLNEIQPLVAIGGGNVAATPLYAPVQQTAQPVQTPQYRSAPQAVEATPTQAAPETRTALATKSCVFLIMAEIRSGGEMAFLQSMQSFGRAERIGDTVWLVRSAHAVEQIRNTLSQTLDQQDRLFILDTSAGKTAWFNIGADLDHRIRELWDEDEG